MMRLAASMPTGSEPRPWLEHKMGGLHLPGALGVCDEAWVSWALLKRLEAYPVIDGALWLAGSQSKAAAAEGGGLLKVEPEHKPLRFPRGSTKRGLSPDSISV